MVSKVKRRSIAIFLSQGNQPNITMKKHHLLAGILAAQLALAQTPEKVTIQYSPCIEFHITKPLSELPVVTEDEYESKKELKEVAIRRKYFTAVNPNALPLGEDPLAQKTMGNKAASPPLASWNGISGGYDPPDPSGAASASHYIQAINCKYRVYTKTGGTVSGGGSFNLSALWPGSGNSGDPIVLYDKHADRWFISQFDDPDKILVAISSTNNPIGTYYAYTFAPQPGTFPDYPKYSIWHDGYYCTSNLGLPGKMAAFDRNKMLAGNNAAGMITVTYPNVPNAGFFCPLSADADGQLPPNGTPCPLFSYEDDSWGGGAADQLRIYDFKVNWTTPANSTLTLKGTLPTQPFNVNFTSNWNDVSQPGSSQKLDAINGVLGFRAQYRIWTGYNSVVFCHSVIVNPTTKQVGLRWYELRQNSSSGVWSIYQQGTYAPDNNSRWLGSMAMDDNGNIALAYAVSSSSTPMSLRYCGRAPGDPLGQMSIAEQTAIAGSGAKSSSNRAGDYSHTALDPDGITFWHTGMYVSSGSAATRIYSFQFPNTTGIDTPNHQLTLNWLQDEYGLRISGENLPNNDNMQVDLFDIEGKLIKGQMLKPLDSRISTNISTEGLAKGLYLVRVGNANFQRVIKVSVN